MEIATLGGGCYWCLEAFYQRIKGVEEVTSGYSGGHTEDPTAEQVYNGDTGHAEVVQIIFNPAVITYREVLEIFFTMHDPTTLNRQGNDIGEWYRSVIFYLNETQKKVAEYTIRNFAPKFYQDPVVTQLKPLTKFWPADDYMQDYYNKNPTASYCLAVIDPKIQKLRAKFTRRLREA